jgi:hypothetical protein
MNSRRRVNSTVRRVIRMWTIEDEFHAEFHGDYDSLDGAFAELRRRAALPWDVEPNVAPCISWRTCGRRYELIEFDTTESPSREVRRIHVLDISAGGVKWIEPFDSISASD